MQEKEVNNKLIKNSFISFLIFLFITALFFVIIIFTSNSVRKNNTDKYGGTFGINSNYIEGYFITEPFLDCKKITDVEKVAIGRNDNDFVYIKYDDTFTMQSALVKKAVGIAFKQYKMLVARYE